MDEDRKNKVSVKNLYKSGKQWYADVEVYWDDELERKGEFSTDIHGDGIWLNGVQQTGTCQFSLSGCSKSAAHKRIVRWFE